MTDPGAPTHDPTSAESLSADADLRRYYSISEVAQQLGVKPSVLRFWESEFPALKPRKTKTGRRLYSAKDLELLKQIVLLVRERRYTLEGARAALRHDRSEVSETVHLRTTLESLKAFLLRLRQGL